MSGRSPALGGTPICIDARMLDRQGSGVATYAQALRRATGELTTRPLLLAASHADDNRFRRAAGALRHVERRIAIRPLADGGGDVLVGRDLFRRAHIHFSLFRGPLRIVVDHPPGIMHWSYPVPIALDGWANIYTVHDVIPILHAGLSSIDPRRHRAVLDALASEAAAIVTVSETARREIVELLRLPDTKVRNAGQAIDAAPPPPAALPAGLRPDGYFLFCGGLDPRKNLVRLIDAHAASQTTLPLAIVGAVGANTTSIVRRIAAAPGVVRLPVQDRDALRRLLQHARALLFPSLAEGFGLPVAEAMALGTAVLTSRGGALEEVADGAALLVDPTDTGALVQGIARLATEGALVEHLAIAGRRRAGAFTPTQFSARLAAIYHDVLADRI